uniref:Retrotransposable element Tf2 n=1 Tax=Cajanus cajan TaxID=3821 RepID=A0A151RMG1_CAJCA|nr:Retrotransposable element Tf2 [Cajanus cajan]
MLEWPKPFFVCNLHGFLGLSDFYHQFICGYASIVRPLNALLKLGSFHWTLEAQVAFNTLKRAMTEALVLALPSFSFWHTRQQKKYETKLPISLLHPLPIPNVIWEDLSLDFIISLPSFSGNIVILVVVDCFSKGAYFGTLPTHFTTFKVAQLFFDHVCKHHGVPRSLVFDHDHIFIRKFWRELFKVCSTKLCMSTSYHPESDGQTDVLNHVLEQYLRSFIHTHLAQWSHFLSLAEWSYNTSVHTATRYFPFQIIFGKPFASIPHYLLGSDIRLSYSNAKHVFVPF